MRLRSKKGQAIVEFTLIFPLLLILIFGIIEFGILLYNKAVITNASREAARFGIVSKVPRQSKGSVEKVATDYCANYLITFGAPDGPNPTATAETNDAAAFQDELTVTVEYDYDFLLIPSFTGLDNSVKLSANTVMLYE